MAPARKVDSEKAAKYAIAASKGFSYYLPKSAQRHLQELLKQLPSAARSIYDEYYRDLMCAKACAPESAVAMAKFVTSSFPGIAKKHNTFSREINEEIDSDEHEGYEPVKFPIVDELEVDEEEGAMVPSKGKKRKRAATGSTSLPIRGAMRRKKAKTKPDTQETPTLGSVTNAPPSPSPGRDLNTPVQARAATIASKSPISTAYTTREKNALRLTPKSISPVVDQQDAFPKHEDLDRHSRNSSPLSAVPFSKDLSDEDASFEEQSSRSKTDGDAGWPQSSMPMISTADDEGRGSSTAASSSSGDLENTMFNAGVAAIVERTIPAEDEVQGEPLPTSSPQSAASPLDNSAGDVFGKLGATVQGLQIDGSLDHVHSESSSESGYAFKSEEERWVNGMEAIESFRWERKGLVNIHYDDVEQSAGLFKGNYWDDVDAERLFLAADNSLIVSDGEDAVEIK